VSNLRERERERERKRERVRERKKEEPKAQYSNCDAGKREKEPDG
jgi:hypothetical protein